MYWLLKFYIDATVLVVLCSNITVDAIVLKIKRWPTVLVVICSNITIDAMVLWSKDGPPCWLCFAQILLLMPSYLGQKMAHRAGCGLHKYYH
jgi:hypothetical protein